MTPRPHWARTGHAALFTRTGPADRQTNPVHEHKLNELKQG
jgi:hypothetical protein